MEEVYDLFSKIYASRVGNKSFLAFEKTGGIPITAEMFKLLPTDTEFSGALAVERISEIGNAVLVPDGDSVWRSNRTIAAIAEMMLTQSIPVAADDATMASLGAAKTEASQAFDATLGSMDGMFRFHPIYANPFNWYDPNAIGNWVSHTIGQNDGPPKTDAPCNPARAFLLQRPVWRVVPPEIQATLSQPVSRIHPIYCAPIARPDRFAAAGNAHIPSVQTDIPSGVTAIRLSPAFSSATSIVAQPLNQSVRRVAPVFPPRLEVGIAGPPPAAALGTGGPLLMAQATARLNTRATIQPVSTNSLEISFDHCVVTLNRAWWPEVFTMLKNWYVPGYERATFSDGTGNRDLGLLPVLASGFVAIRNLSISAKSARWASDDLVAMQGSASFGPFSLVGRSYDAKTETITCPGIQIIGWFCEALPVLPPESDPGIKAAPQVVSPLSPVDAQAAAPSETETTADKIG